MRVVKDAKERKAEILDAAEKLFMTKGYDNTCTNDILDEVGIARGTLYYHFRSKEEILNAVIERMVNSLSAKAQSIANRKEIPAMQRVALAIMAMNVDGELGREIAQQIHKPQNALMHQKTENLLLSRIDPIVSDIIEEAVREGICFTDYPREMVEMTMLYAEQTFDSLAELSEQERMQKVDAFIYNIEKLLSMEQGSMRETLLPLFVRQ